MKKTSFKIERTCVSTRKKSKQEDLLRVTFDKKSWKLNEVNKIQGRSFYITKDKKSIQKFLKKKNYGFIKNFVLNDEIRTDLENYAQNL